jgi:hypothetical protein
MPVVDALAEYVPTGYHCGLRVDLTEEMRDFKPQIPWKYSNAYYHMEFVPAMAFLEKHIEEMCGGEFFWKQLHYAPVPASWKQMYQKFPGTHPKSTTLMKAFGMKYRCDHFRTSGCQVTMLVQRDYAFDPSKDIFTIAIQKGHHRMACNHIGMYGQNCGHHYPALHPVIDMYLRARVKRNTQSRLGLVYSDIAQDLKAHLRSFTTLHCELRHAHAAWFVDGSRDKKGAYKRCSHFCNYTYVASRPGYTAASKMPSLEDAPGRVGNSPGPYQRTESRFVRVDHMMLEDGHSINGNHVFQFKTLCQIKTRLAHYNGLFRGDGTVDETTTDESGVGPLHKCFQEQNLFKRWEKHMSKDPKEYKNLGPFEWCMVGILYRKRTKAENKAAMEKKDPTETTREDGDYPEQSDPKNLPYEFVVVFASLFSLLISVKAWGCRKVMGEVTVCADNMYNPLKGVPNMYWFNTGVLDKKNIHFPTVNALQLGRAAPRNEVVVLLCCFVVVLFVHCDICAL